MGLELRGMASSDPLFRRRDPNRRHTSVHGISVEVAFTKELVFAVIILWDLRIDRTAAFALCMG